MGMTPTHQADLCYCCVRAADIESEDLLSKLKQAEVHSFINKALCSNGKVLVHCLVCPSLFAPLLSQPEKTTLLCL